MTLLQRTVRDGLGFINAAPTVHVAHVEFHTVRILTGPAIRQADYLGS